MSPMSYSSIYDCKYLLLPKNMSIFSTFLINCCHICKIIFTFIVLYSINMKSFHQIVFGFYVLIGLYLLYFAIMHTYIYFANRSLGYVESFGVAGRYWLGFLIFSVIIWVAWHSIKGKMNTFGMIVLYFPIVVALLYGLWAILITLSSGGRWN